MAKICPVCKKHRMYLGGFVIKNSTICGKCYDRLASRNLTYYNKNLEIEDIWYIFENTEENQDIRETVQKILNKKEQFAKETAACTGQFKKALADFFNAKNIPENSAIQNSATQFLWHMLVLKKRRLDAKNIRLNIETKQNTVNAEKALSGREYFNGKYETGTVRETIQGFIKYIKNDDVIFQEDKFNAARYRTLRAHRTGNKNIICPFCGASSTRGNLIDGCDFCGTKFSVEDLGLRINGCSFEKDYNLAAQEYFSQDNEKKAGIKAGFISFILLAIVSVLNVFMGEFKISDLFSLLLGSAIFGGLIGLVFSFFYGIFIKGIVWLFKSSTGEMQAAQRAANELERFSKNVTAKIQQTDPLFSVEGFYSEIENILSSVHYASKAEQIKVFWNEMQPDKITEIINKYQNVISFEIQKIQLQDYLIEENIQKITVEATAALLLEENSIVHKKAENLKLRFVKNENCKTQEICAPAFLRCRNCGSSLSLMEGAHCHSCGSDVKLSDFAWTIDDYKTSYADTKN